MVIYHIDMVIYHIKMGYGLMIWEMTVSIWSSPISIWDILSLWPCTTATLAIETARTAAGEAKKAGPDMTKQVKL